MTTLTTNNINEFMHKVLNFYCKQWEGNADVKGSAVIVSFDPTKRNPIRVDCTTGEGRFLNFAIVNDNGEICIGDEDRPVILESMVIKLYKVNTTESYRADEQGIGWTTEIPQDTIYYKHNVLDCLKVLVPANIGYFDVVTDTDGSILLTNADHVWRVVEGECALVYTLKELTL